MRLHLMPFRRLDRGASRGFTLIELMITVAIVGILAAIAIPSYSKYVIRGKLPVAFGVLSGWGTAMAQFYQDNRNYSNACAAGTAPIPADTGGFTFACTKSAQTFSLSATGLSGTPVYGFIFTLAQDGSKSSIAPVAAGWTSNPTCWIRDPSGSC